MEMTSLAHSLAPLWGGDGGLLTKTPQPGWGIAAKITDAAQYYCGISKPAWKKGNKKMLIPGQAPEQQHSRSFLPACSGWDPAILAFPVTTKPTGLPWDKGEHGEFSKTERAFVSFFWEGIGCFSIKEGSK